MSTSKKRFDPDEDGFYLCRPWDGMTAEEWEEACREAYIRNLWEEAMHVDPR